MKPTLHKQKLGLTNEIGQDARWEKVAKAGIGRPLPLSQTRRQKSVLFLTNRFSTGGVETHILALAKALKARGYFVAVASSGGSMVGLLEKSGILHFCLPLEQRKLSSLLFARNQLKKLIKDYHFTLLHAHARLPAFLVRTLGNLPHTRFVSTAHLDFSLSLLTRYLVRWGEGVLAVSKDIREYLVREYQVDRDKIALTVNGIDTEQYSPQKGRWASGKPCEIKTIVHVSRMDRDRAMSAFLLCRVMAKLHPRFGARLLIVGGGELFDRLQKEAEAVNAQVGKCITLVGEQSDILPYLAKADLFVGVSRAALEAMACGIPTVLAGNSGYLGIFQKDRKEEAAATNFCCRGAPKATRVALCKDIATLLTSSPEELCAMSEYARAVVEREYSVCRMADDYERFYASLPNGKPRRFEMNLILGYHGFGNLGDEMLLDDMLKRLRAKGDRGFTVLSHTPKATAARYAVSAVSRYDPFSVFTALLFAKVLYVGGGTILQSETSKRSFWYYATLIRLAKLLGKTVVFWANGLAQYTPREQLTVAKLLQGKSIVLLRDQESFCLAKALITPLAEKDKPYIALVADGGFLQKPSQNSTVAARIKALSPYFVLCLHGNCLDDTRRSRLLRLASMAEKRGLRAILLVMQPSVDSKESNRLATACFSLTKHKPVVVTPSAAEAVALVAKSAFVISMRFHPLVFAASQNIPALCISESEKAKRLMRVLYSEDAILSLKGEDEAFFRSVERFLCAVLQKEKLGMRYYPNDAALAEMKKRSYLLTTFLDEGVSFLTREKHCQKHTIP